MAVETPVIVKASAPAKIILFGEHSVVYGAPAIAASIDRRTTVELTDNNKKRLNFQFKKLKLEFSLDLPLKGNPKLPENLNTQQRQALECGILIFKELNLKSIKGFDVTVNSDFPLGAGLGSSASFSVALASAFLARSLWPEKVEIPVPTKLYTKIKVLADKCEAVFHGNPSGIDTATCALGGIVKFQKGKEVQVQKISQNLPMKVAIINSKVERQTSAIVEKVKNMRDRLTEPSEAIFSAMSKVAEAAADEIANPKSQENLLELVRMNHGLLCAIGVSHPILERIGLAASGLGVGFKLTGAGVGGNALVFIPPEISSEVVCCKLHQGGYEPSVVSVGVEGIMINYVNQ